MTIVLTEVVRPKDADPYSWLPFPDGHHRYSTGWWDDGYRFHHATGRRWFVADQGGTEVGRIEVSLTSGDDYYVGAAVLGQAPILDIEFIEVASEHRRRGIGTTIVSQLAATVPGHRLVAFSEEADAFWSSLGWRRIDHPEGPHFRQLFVQPR